MICKIAILLFCVSNLWFCQAQTTTTTNTTTTPTTTNTTTTTTPNTTTTTTPTTLSNELSDFAKLSSQEREGRMWEFLGSDAFNRSVTAFQNQDANTIHQQLQLMTSFLKENPTLQTQLSAFHKFFSRDPDEISKEILSGMNTHMTMMMQNQQQPPLPFLPKNFQPQPQDFQPQDFQSFQPQDFQSFQPQDFQSFQPQNFQPFQPQGFPPEGFFPVGKLRGLHNNKRKAKTIPTQMKKLRQQQMQKMMQMQQQQQQMMQMMQQMQQQQQQQQQQEMNFAGFPQGFAPPNFGMPFMQSNNNNHNNNHNNKIVSNVAKLSGGGFDDDDDNDENENNGGKLN